MREHARRFGFALADKHESQEICFVGQEGYAATVEKILGQGGRGGNFMHTDGTVIGSTKASIDIPSANEEVLGLAGMSLSMSLISMRHLERSGSGHEVLSMFRTCLSSIHWSQHRHPQQTLSSWYSSAIAESLRLSYG